MFYFVGHDSRYRWLNLCNLPTSIFLFLIIPLILPHRHASSSLLATHILCQIRIWSCYSPTDIGSPLWSKEKIKPIVVQEGVSLVLPCRPPAGLPPPIIFWMDNSEQLDLLCFFVVTWCFCCIRLRITVIFFFNFLFHLTTNHTCCISFCKLGCWKCGNCNIFFLLSHLLVSFHSLKFITWKILNGNKLIFSLMNCISECEYLWLDA